MRVVLAVLQVVAAALWAAGPAPAFAQAYPSKPIRMVVPFPPGGPADIFGRHLAQGMAAHLGQPIPIENVSGVGGVVGVDRVAKSPPDGYTLVLNSASPLAISPFALSRMPFDPLRDLTLITTVVRVPEVLAVHPSVPAQTLAELVAYAKARPGRINFGSSGPGTITHLAGELLKAEAGLDLVHVPYKGAAPAVADLLAGQIQFCILDVPVLLPHIRAGKLRAIAVSSPRRAPSLPEVPTTAEGGYAGVVSDNWYGLAGPAGLPPVIVRRLHAAAVAALGSEELAEQYGRVSGIPMPSSPEEYAAFLVQEQKKWGGVVRAVGFKAE